MVDAELSSDFSAFGEALATHRRLSVGPFDWSVPREGRERRATAGDCDKGGPPTGPIAGSPGTSPPGVHGVEDEVFARPGPKPAVHPEGASGDGGFLDVIVET